MEARSELAGQEVTFSKAIAAEVAAREDASTASSTGLTKEDIERDLAAAAERKAKIDEAKSRKAGEDYEHVRFSPFPFLSVRACLEHDGRRCYEKFQLTSIGYNSSSHAGQRSRSASRGEVRLLISRLPRNIGLRSLCISLLPCQYSRDKLPP